MLLRVVDDGVFRDIRIEEGEMFLLPGTHRTRNIPTSVAE
jgi:3-hydroxyanthranilate 3,4-dioxygenase